MQILKFLQWQWQRWELWQRVYIISFLVFALNFVTDDPWRTWIMISVISVWLSFALKWLIWDRVRDSWQTYQKERLELFERIRDSDR